MPEQRNQKRLRHVYSPFCGVRSGGRKTSWAQFLFFCETERGFFHLEFCEMGKKKGKKAADSSASEDEVCEHFRVYSARMRCGPGPIQTVRTIRPFSLSLHTHLTCAVLSRHVGGRLTHTVGCAVYSRADRVQRAMVRSPTPWPAPAWTQSTLCRSCFVSSLPLRAAPTLNTAEADSTGAAAMINPV